MNEKLPSYWLFRGMSFVVGWCAGCLATLVAVTLLSEWVAAATYSVIFNNVEQGAGSTASPVVQIENGKAARKQEDSLAGAQAAPTAPPVAAEPAPAQTISAAQVDVPAQDDSGTPLRPWRLDFLAHSLGQTIRETFGEDRFRAMGGTLSVAYFPLKDLGVSLRAGLGGNLGRSSYFGGDLEFVPARLSLFGHRDLLEAGVVLGASNLGRVPGHWGTVHGGIRAAVRFSERYAIAAGLRTNLSSRDRFEYGLAEAGLSVRF